METASTAQGSGGAAPPVPPQGSTVRTTGWRSFFKNYKVPSFLKVWIFILHPKRLSTEIQENLY